MGSEGRISPSFPLAYIFVKTVFLSQMAKDGVLVASVKDTQQCPKCETLVPRIPHPKELAELAEEVRQRMIKAERTSYWRQFEQGMLGRDAVLVLIHLADTVLDTPERLITLRDLSPYWQIPLILKKIVSHNSTTWSLPKLSVI